MLLGYVSLNIFSYVPFIDDSHIIHRPETYLDPILRLYCRSACKRTPIGHKESFKASVVASCTKDGQCSFEILAFNTETTFKSLSQS